MEAYTEVIMNRENLKNIFVTPASVAITLSLIVLAAGCGKQSYDTLSVVSQSQAAGSFTTPAKVDILLTEDDTGSMRDAYSSISQLMPQFLASLQSSGWDYHFATVPMTHNRSLGPHSVAASQYDSGWGSQWTPPYPGAQANGPGMVVGSFFTLPQNYQGFLGYGDIQGGLGGLEPTFQTLWNDLNDSTFTSSHFLRADSLFVILAIGNGDDTSGVKYCPRSPGSQQRVPCEQAYNPDYSQATCGTPGVSASNCYPGTQSGAVSAFANAFRQIPGHGSSPVQFYAAVSTQNTGNGCFNGQAYGGSQYMNMAATMGGASYDVCQGGGSISSVISQLSGQLQATRDSYKTRYIFIDHSPADLTKVTVTKNGQTLIKDDPNGWTYVGNTTVYAIDYPTPMNQQTGYAIRLNGTAELVGTDTSSVTFQ